MSETQRARPAPIPTVQLITRVSPELKERVSALARKRGCFETRVIVEALDAYLSTQEKRASR